MHKEPVTQCTRISLLTSISLGFLYQSTTCTERTVKRGNWRALRASNLQLVLLCDMHVLHKLCSTTREIQSTYATSNNSSPSPRNPESVM